MDPPRLSQGYPGPRSEQGQTSKPQQRLDSAGGGGGGGGGRINPFSPSPPPRKSSLASRTAGSREALGDRPGLIPPGPLTAFSPSATSDASNSAAALGTAHLVLSSAGWERGGCCGPTKGALVTCSPSSLHHLGAQLHPEAMPTSTRALMLSLLSRILGTSARKATGFPHNKNKRLPQRPQEQNPDGNIPREKLSTSPNCPREGEGCVGASVRVCLILLGPTHSSYVTTSPMDELQEIKPTGPGGCAGLDQEHAEKA